MKIKTKISVSEDHPGRSSSEAVDCTRYAPGGGGGGATHDGRPRLPPPQKRVALVPATGPLVSAAGSTAACTERLLRAVRGGRRPLVYLRVWIGPLGTALGPRDIRRRTSSKMGAVCEWDRPRARM